MRTRLRELKENRNLRVQWHRFCYYWYFLKIHYYGTDKFQEKADIQKELWEQWEQVPAPAKSKPAGLPENPEGTPVRQFYLRMKTRLQNAMKKADA
ncbi:hypothetical protein [Alteribacter natronophilus]|uniref:hypothetical protein n=1 Tax=Alteribacter natronophilus TaxID=2583810 RepID=UPI00110E00A9|nr:hypothetical protein [Alteribacter natronophilus]TMW70421.1 hypothetical protein FGB90_17285 [Alteribacter natronophilus]